MRLRGQKKNEGTGSLRTCPDSDREPDDKAAFRLLGFCVRRTKWPRKPTRTTDEDPMPDAIGTPAREINKDRDEKREEGSDIDKDEAQRHELDGSVAT